MVGAYHERINIFRLSTGEYVVRQGYGELSSMFSGCFTHWYGANLKRQYAKRFKTKDEAKAFIVLLKDFR